MNKIKISVIIPAYNAGPFLAEAIESVLAQRYADVEVIVVNDGSTDNTLEIASGFGERITVITQKNSGVAASRNYGSKCAKGEYLAFLDADDVWLPDKLELQAKKILAGFPFVYSNRYNFGQIGDLPLVQSDIMLLPEGSIWNLLVYGNMITTSSVVIRKDIFEEFCGFDPELPQCEDWDLWLKCAEIYLIGCCPEPLVKYRVHPGGISRKYSQMNRMRQVVIQRALASAPGSGLSGQERRKITAGIWSSSGWEAAVDRNYPHALAYYLRALSFTPLNYRLWYDVARIMAGRV
jgi:teichuronic acid biosynthesis glycosyltransferase TuaG